MPGIQVNTDKVYLRIVGGNLVRRVDEGTQGARKRKYKTPKGQEGEVWELVYRAWEGVIRRVDFYDNDYGKVCNVVFDDATITLPIDGRYFQDFASKIFNADIAKPLIFHPYDIGEDSDRKVGVSLKQRGEKLSNYFYDFDEKKRLHGFPEPEEEKKDTNGYWKYYFSTVSSFLVKKLEELNFPLEAKEEPKEENFEDGVPLPEPPPEDYEYNDEGLPF